MAKKTINAAEEKKRVAAIYRLLQETYPEAACTLNFRSPLQLLIMTILAAQCTDARVNIVCTQMFKDFQSVDDFADAAPGALEKAIHACGFFNQKARAIRESCRMLRAEYNSQVPDTMDDLLRLPGVGRKIANAVLGECFGKPAVVVDTHCKRVANRLGFTRHQDPGKIEIDLQQLWQPEHWTMYSQYMVHHGRAYCLARSPKCADCPLFSLCPWPEKDKRAHGAF
ncbi:MAG TPA: endonuclease III [Candidatus Hydrogenedentes bacterium]|jgi:endonuclease-3|nr:endonuclease III [Candidatus Hydrogenedentota bacterium]